MKKGIAILLMGIVFITLIPQSSAYNIKLTYLDLSGNTHSFAEFEGKWLFVEVFRHDCPHCINQHPDLQQLYDLRVDVNNSKMEMLSLAVSSDTVEEIQTFLNDHPTPWNIGRDPQNSFSNTYGITGTPTMILFDTKGNAAKSWVGETPLSTLLTDIDPFLSGEKSATITDLKAVGNAPSSGQSLIGSIVGNPIAQAGFLISLFLLVYFKLTSPSPDATKKSPKKETNLDSHQSAKK